MSINLDKELNNFKTRVKEEDVAKVEYRPGHSSAGAIGIYALMLMLLLLVRRQNKLNM